MFVCGDVVIIASAKEPWLGIVQDKGTRGGLVVRYLVADSPDSPVGPWKEEAQLQSVPLGSVVAKIEFQGALRQSEWDNITGLYAKFMACSPPPKICQMSFSLSSSTGEEKILYTLW
jgi:hypothetical protein